MQLRGLYTATITPYTDDLEIDYPALDRHLRSTAESVGVKGLVVNGGIGELFTLTPDERTAVIEHAVQQRIGDQLVIAGVEGRTPAAAIAMGLEAKAAGADALLVLPPFDARPYRRLVNYIPAVVGFFTELAEKVDLPIVIFAYPKKSHCAYDVETLAALAEIENVVAIKVASQDLAGYSEVWDRLHDTVSVLAASDSPPLLEMLRYGTHGALIGISCIEPALFSGLLDAAAKGDEKESERIFTSSIAPLMSSVFENQNRTGPTSDGAATKEALVQLGRLQNSKVRAPAVSVNDDERGRIAQGLRDAGLLVAAGQG